MIGFAGLSHLGIVMSAATAAKGFPVLAYDARVGWCEALERGQLPVREPGLEALIEKARSHLRFTADAAAMGQCDPVFLSLDTPTGSDDRPDLAPLGDLLEVVAAHAAPGAALVVLSQVPPGFTRQIARRLRAERPERRFALYHQVETLVFGRAVERAMHPERVIVGCDDPAVPLPRAYADVLGAWACPVLAMRYESAELAKISINLFLAAVVTTTNTLAELCEATGADWSEIVPALRLDRRIGPDAYLAPGPGIGGGHLERDLAAVDDLAREHGTDAGLVTAMLANSRHRREWVLERLRADVLSRGGQPTIAVWGVAYKPGTASTKNSPAVALLEALPPLPVRAYDPEATLPDGVPGRVAVATSPIEACRGAAALAVMTAWPQFGAVALEDVRAVMAGRTIVDPLGVLDGRRAAALGFCYARMGAPVVAPAGGRA